MMCNTSQAAVASQISANKAMMAAFWLHEMERSNDAPDAVENVPAALADLSGSSGGCSIAKLFAVITNLANKCACECECARVCELSRELTDVSMYLREHMQRGRCKGREDLG
jgi:hypothetical protein